MKRGYLLVLIFCCLFSPFSNFAQPFLVIGEDATIQALSVGERNAYSWAITHFSQHIQYLSFDSIHKNGVPPNTRSIWFHYEKNPSLPSLADSVAPVLEAFLEKGGGLMLSGFATSFALSVNATQVPTSQTFDIQTAGPDDDWGIRPFPQFADHPIFDSIPETMDWAQPSWKGFRTVSDNIIGREAINWWTNNTYPGTGMAAMPWFSGMDIPVVGQIDKGLGRIITVSCPGYQWKPAAQNGMQEQANLERFTANVMNYLLPKETFVLLGDSADISTLRNGEMEAYNWALANLGFTVSYHALNEIEIMGIPAETQVIWLHHEHAFDTLPGSDSLVAFVEKGGGLFLSGMATALLSNWEKAEIPDLTFFTDSVTPKNNWGIRPYLSQQNHPIFKDIPSSNWPNMSWDGFRTISMNVTGREAVSWWNRDTYPGIPLGTIPSNTDESFAAVGDFRLKAGRIITTSCPGYQWFSTPFNGVSEQAALEQFTLNVLSFLDSVYMNPGMWFETADGGNELAERDIDGAEVILHLRNAIFEDSLRTNFWQFSALPTNVQVAVNLLDSMRVELRFSGVPDDFDEDIFDVSQRIPASDVKLGVGQGLTDQGGLILRAFEETMGVGASFASMGIRIGSNRSILTLQSERYLGDFEMLVFGLDGRMLKRESFFAHHRLDWVHGLAPGIYLFSIQQEGLSVWRKVMIR